MCWRECTSEANKKLLLGNIDNISQKTHLVKMTSIVNNVRILKKYAKSSLKTRWN